MANHTSFKTGGPAALWIRPEADCFSDFAALLLETARNEGIPVFVMGGGANIVVSDRGIDGIVLDTTGYTGQIRQTGQTEAKSDTILYFRAGTKPDDAAEIAAARGLSGLEFLAGMPGSIGGALWMNARCYDREISDVVHDVLLLEGDKLINVIPKKEQFAYKKSPFQEKDCLILNVSFALQEKNTDAIKKEMNEHRNDRVLKGHYRFPSAGSVFKNNKAFGKPTGQIIDELGLKGMSLGDAQIAPWHGNIIINKGKASSFEIKSLVEIIEKRVKTELGLALEREIIFAGNF
jgi:UDP-N-acetylmuramate dehydrogenase